MGCLRKAAGGMDAFSGNDEQPIRGRKGVVCREGGRAVTDSIDCPMDTRRPTLPDPTSGAGLLVGTFPAQCDLWMILFEPT